MKRIFSTACIAAFCLPMPLHALDLSVGASVGGIDANVSASVGHGSVADVGASVGSGGSGSGLDVDASVGLGGGGYGGGGSGGGTNPGTNPGTGTNGPSNTPGQTNGNPNGLGNGLPLVMVKAFMGRPVVSSDGILLGRVNDIKPSGKACPMLGVKTNPGLDLDYSQVWLKTSRCGGGDGAIRLGMKSSTFINRATN